MNRAKTLSAKCFIPSCKNTTTNSPNKVFVFVKETLKKKWCEEVNVKYVPGRRLYCCEDHVNLEEDLENYQYFKLMKGNPILKGTAKLRRIQNFPSCRKKYTNTIAETSTTLKSLLLKPIEKVQMLHTTNLTRHTEYTPTITSTSTQPMIVSVLRKLASTTITQARKPLPPQDLNQSLHVAGDGDRARCCRLCRGDSDLKYFMETCVWEGVEEQYGQLVYDCFGVQVTPSDSMVCEWCIRALRTTQKLRALVRAAFDKRHSDMGGIMAAATSNSTVISCKTPTSLNQQKLENQLQLRKKPMPRRPLGMPLPSRRRETTKKWINNDMQNVNKRVIVNCERCRQRYPILVPNGEPVKTFLCARCKKDGEARTAACKQCGIIIALNLMKAHTELHAKAQARAKARNRQLKKQLTPTPTTQLEMSKDKKFKCNKCPKRFNIGANLAAHMLNVHEECNTYSYDTKQNESEATPETSPLNPHTVTPLESSEFQLLFKNQRVQNLSVNPEPPLKGV